MKRRLFLVISVLLFVSACATQSDLNPSLYPSSIPSHVRYSPPSEDECIAAKQLLEKAMSSESDKPIGLFQDVVAIDHLLWSEIKTKEPYKSDPGPPIGSIVNNQIVEGKGLLSNSSMAALELMLRAKLNSEGTITIRPPDRSELTKYWSVIAWDLEFPLFIAETNKTKIFFQFDEGHAGNIVILK